MELLFFPRFNKKKKALPAFRNIIFEDKPIMPVAFSGERKKSAF